MQDAKETPCEAGRESVADQTVRLHSVNEVCRLLGGMGRTWFYAEVAAKRIRPIKLGTRTLVSSAELRRYIADREAGCRE